MSYIVPRNKPDRCTNCTFMDRITYDCKLMYGDDYPDFEAQYNNCPLIAVPSHGRLIDADELVRIWKGAKFYGNIEPIVNARPTVIEAEGSETDA